MQNDINKYLDYLKFEKRLSENTLKAYKNDLEVFSAYIKKSITHINKEDVQSFLYSLDKSSKTKAHYITVLNSFFNFLISENVTKENPARAIKMPKLEKKLPNYLSVEEVDKLLEFDLITEFDYRNKAMLELMYATGIRISELISLKLQNIDFFEEVIKVSGKGSKERMLPINSIAVKYLKIWINSYRDKILKGKTSDYVFLNHHGNMISRQGFFKIIKKRAEDSEIKKDISPHTLRHSFATHLLNNGADIRVIQELLGHENLVTTEIYAHLQNKKITEEYQFHPHAKK